MFECDAEFQKSVNITDELFVGGDFTTVGHLIEIADPTTGCTNPNLINIHGEVHIDCNLFVSGDVFYDGDLQITGPDITFGAGCDLSTIHLQGHTVAHCDMVVEGHTAPFALVVKKNLQVYESTEILGFLNVAKDSAHDARLLVHEDTLLNLPVPALEYWEQCECIDGVMWGLGETPQIGEQFNRAPDHTTFIHGTQKSLCQVYLNDPRWYKDNNADPHVQMTEVYGSLFARANVDLNSNAAKSADGNHQQKTSIWGQLQQYSVVELNKYIDTGDGHGYNNGEHATQDIQFNTLTNKNQTVVHGDANFRKSVILNDGKDRLTVVQGKFEAREEARLEKNVHLSGGNSGNSRQCGTYSTHIWGDLVQHCSTTLGEGCGDQVTINGKVYMMSGVNLSNSWGNSNVTGGERGFWQSGAGTDCAAGSWMHAVTSAVSGSSQSGNTSDINITVSNYSNDAGATTISGNAGNTKLTINAQGLLTGGSSSLSANESSSDKTLNIGITKDIICTVLGKHTIKEGTGIKVSDGNYTTCGDTTTTISFDPSVLPDPCDKMKPLIITVSGEGSGGGTYNPCAGETIDIKINKQEGEGGDASCDGTVTINQGGNKKGEFSICGSDTTIDLDAGGTGSPGSGKLVLKAGSGIKIAKGTNNNFNANQPTGKDCEWTFNVDPDSCPAWTTNVSGRAFYARRSGGKKDPAYVMGTLEADGKNKAWCGIGSNTANGSFTVYYSYEGWENIDNCGGNPAGGDDDIEKLMSVASGDKVKQHMANVGLLNLAKAENGTVECFKYGGNDSTTDDNSLHGGPPEAKTYNRFCFRPSNASHGRFEELTSADSRTVFDIDSMIDELGTMSNGAAKGVSTGIIRWNLKKSDEDALPMPAMYIDSDELAARFPALVHWTATEDVYEPIPLYDSEGNIEGYDHRTIPENIGYENMEPGSLNDASINCYNFIAHKRHKTRIDRLEQSPTIKGPATFEDIIKIDLDSLRHAEDDQEAANMGVSIGQVYRNGSQLMVRVT